MDLEAVILTHDEAYHIEACIGSLRWADQILVFDSYSEDDTVDRARKAGAKVMQHEWVDYAHQRDAALQAATGEWVLFVDADERATPALAAEIRQAIEGPEAGWWVPRENYIFGRLTRGAGWYPDYQLRLLRRQRARYDLNRPVHELVVLDGTAGYLQSPLVHYNYDNLGQFIRKQRYYATLEARRLAQDGLQPAWRRFLTVPGRHFWYRFVTLRGYTDGLHGLWLSLLMAAYQAEVQRQLWLRKRAQIH